MGLAPGPAPYRGLPRRLRVVDSPVFREALDGPAQVGRFIILRLWHGKGAGLRLGVIASKRTFRRSVDRNRARRRIREAFRLNRNRLTGDADLIILARRRILDATCHDVQNELLSLARRAGIRGDAGDDR